MAISKENKEIKETIEAQNEELKNSLSETESYWNETIENLSKKLLKPVQEIIEVQSEVISLRQILTEEIKGISYEIYKFKQKMKVYEKERLEFYLLGYVAKTSGGEKAKLIESDLSLYQHRLDIFDVHVNFLRESQRDVDNLNFAIKNKITLYQLADLE